MVTGDTLCKSFVCTMLYLCFGLEPGCAEVSSVDGSNSLAEVAEKKETN